MGTKERKETIGVYEQKGQRLKPSIWKKLKDKVVKPPPQILITHLTEEENK